MPTPFRLNFRTVGDILGAVAAAAGVFAGTNIDDLLVLTVLFLSSRATGKPRPWQIWTGQYAGIAALVGTAAIAALGLTVVPDRWIGLLGIVPFALGLKALVAAWRAHGEDDEPPPIATGVLAIAGVTIANGADNLAVYTPMFRTIGLPAALITVVVFAVGVALWCLAAHRLGSHRRVVDVVRRCGHWIVPGIFLLIGALILLSLVP
jgi:cadmium resistance protein CadD (predicted permease)